MFTALTCGDFSQNKQINYRNHYIARRRQGNFGVLHIMKPFRCFTDKNEQTAQAEFRRGSASDLLFMR